MPYIVFDLIVAAVLLLFFWRGWRKGLILTLCGILAVFVAFFGASRLSGALAEPVAAAIEPAVSRVIHDALTQTIQHSSAEQSAAELLTDIPLDTALDVLRNSERFSGLVAAFEKAVDDGVTQAVSGAARSLAHFVAVQLARIALFALAFFAVLIAWFFLSHALDLVAKLPVLNGVNRWTGAALGLAEGALLVFIAVWLLRDSYLPAQTVEHTWLLRLFCSYSPLDLLP